MQGDTVLVTGATGRIGRVVIADLVSRGFRVRATTSRAAVDAGNELGIDWRTVDFLRDADLDALVSGCQAVIHLAAELGRMDRMRQVNTDATMRLAAAAERTGCVVFCYVSSVAVYGSGRSVEIDEDSPCLTPDRDVASEYRALDYVRMYGRTKLAGELALEALADRVVYLVARPAVVVDVRQIIGVREWKIAKRLLTAHRHAHHVYVGDVSDALIWLMQRGLEGFWPPGRAAVFNVAEDDREGPRYIDFMRKALAVSGDVRFRAIAVPSIADRTLEALRFRSMSLRYPLWRMRFSSKRLEAAGYRFPYGMAEAERLALASLTSG